MLLKEIQFPYRDAIGSRGLLCARVEDCIMYLSGGEGGSRELCHGVAPDIGCQKQLVREW